MGARTSRVLTGNYFGMAALVRDYKTRHLDWRNPQRLKGTPAGFGEARP
jgi:hypothetical protein